MPNVLDPPPLDVEQQLAELRTALDEQLPARHLDRNLLVATWNLRAFGDLTDKWRSDPDDSPKRDLLSLLCITEIVRRFDVVAIQEVRDNIRALRHMLKALGPDWGLIMTDVTLGSRGNGERMAFVFDTRRVKPSGLAGELVVPEEWLQAEDLSPTALRRQFARTPYAVSFLAGRDTFILVTLHVIYGQDETERVRELAGIARWLADWAQREQSWGHNLIALGDFNIDRKGDAAYQAFTSTGLSAPDELQAVPRTIFESGKNKFYDQIAWFSGTSDTPVLSLRYGGRAGSFDFPAVVQTSLSRLELSWRVSDHYPLWVEFLSSRA